MKKNYEEPTTSIHPQGNNADYLEFFQAYPEEYERYLQDLQKARELAIRVWKKIGIYYGHGPSHVEDLLQIAQQLLIDNDLATVEAFFKISLAAILHDVFHPTQDHAYANADFFSRSFAIPAEEKAHIDHIIRQHEGHPVQQDTLARLFCLADKLSITRERIAFFIQVVKYEKRQGGIDEYVEYQRNRVDRYRNENNPHNAQNPLVGEERLSDHYQKGMQLFDYFIEHPDEMLVEAKKYVERERKVLKSWGVPDEEIDGMLKGYDDVLAA